MIGVAVSARAGEAVPSAFLGAIIRRFCSCELERVCRCGLPRTRTGWTVASLSRLREVHGQTHDLTLTAMMLGETRNRCNLALDHLIGRTPAHALAALEAAAEKRS